VVESKIAARFENTRGGREAERVDSAERTWRRASSS
jgi:hypothetical protein